ncbi:class I SAM-dependent methyltransferase [Fredinandcohnia humi]
MNAVIKNVDDLLSLLDDLLKDEARFSWDEFYKKRDRNVPFFNNFPDENLVSYFDSSLINPGKVLELGCGPGRNAIYLSEKGCIVDAVDSSRIAIEWGKERALKRNVTINFLKMNIFKLDILESTYDFVYDSGYFHHIAPHRRMSYIDLIWNALKPGGYFALTCFVEGGEFGGSPISDLEVYQLRSLQGGLGYTEEKLRQIFSDFEVIELRKMEKRSVTDRVFGVNGLWTALFKKK